jgi:hypothetical protein
MVMVGSMDFVGFLTVFVVYRVNVVELYLAFTFPA